MSAYIHSIGTAVPPFRNKQSDISDFMLTNLDLSEAEARKVKVLYRASGIQTRYSVLEDFSTVSTDGNFFGSGSFPSAKPRMIKYQEHAIGLGQKAVEDCIKGNEKAKSAITHLIAISCTGMYAPGLDIELIERLGLSTDVQRTSINFMGCYAAFNGLKTAKNIIESDPEATVLVVAVELCTLHLQDATDDESLLSNAIFADGAAAVLLSGKPSSFCISLDTFYADLFFQGKQEMGWFIGDNGFEMKLSPEVPAVIQEGISELTQKLLDKIAIKFSDISLFAIHPGGKRILEVIEQELSISKEQNYASREILRDYGNMSSPTVLFVLKKLMNSMTQAADGKSILSFAFGPGLTMESAILKVHYA